MDARVSYYHLLRFLSSYLQFSVYFKLCYDMVMLTKYVKEKESQTIIGLQGQIM